MKIIFIGTGEIGAPALTALAKAPEHSIIAVITQPDRPVGRHQKLTPSPIKELAFKLHLKIFQPVKISHKSVVEQIQYMQPDLIVVAAYGQILSKSIIELAPKGCLNIHASLLPKYRGASPIQAAIRQGETKTGITIMWMDEGLDTGDILYQESTPIRATDTAKTLHDRLATIGAKAVLKAIDLISKDKAMRKKQDQASSSYAAKLKKENGLIDWSKSKREIEMHIRAMTPWPSAFTWLKDGDENKMLKVFATIISRRAKGTPGEVLRVDKHGILVAAGSGGLLLREVQLEGKKRMHAAEFARGFNLVKGTIFANSKK